MTEGSKRFEFTNRYGETLEAWKNGNGSVHFTHSDADPTKVYEFDPHTLTKSEVLLDSDELHFLMQVYRSDA